MRHLWLIAVLGLWWGGTAVPAAAAGGQTAVRQQAALVTENEALVSFPNTVDFRLAVDSDSPVTSAVLHYTVDKFSCVEVDTRVPVAVADNQAQWRWVMVRSGNPPPGTRLSWTWTISDAAGNQTTTPVQEVTLMDTRFDWQTVSTEGIHVNWYEGDDVGPTLLAAAETGRDRLQSEMGIELVDEIEFYIYASADDMRQAVLYIQDWAGGVAFSEYNTILIGVPPRLAGSWGSSTVQHELAHLVVGQFGRSCVGGSRPTWLEEGLAVVAEGEPDSGILADLKKGIEENAFQPLRSLNGAFPAHGGEAGIAYSQSYSVVTFLLDAYGREKMQALIQALAGGAGYDEALELVYGFNIDGLELAWREAIGAPSRTIPPTPTPVRAAAVPTAIPSGLVVAMPTPSSYVTVPAPDAAGPAAQADRPGLCGLGLLPLLPLLLLARRRET